MSNKKTDKLNLKSYPDRQEYRSSEELEGSLRNFERKALHPDRNMSGSRKRGNKQTEGKPGPSEQENEEETTEVVDKKERTDRDKKEIILYVSVAVVMVLVAVTVINTYQLKEYDNKFAEMNNQLKEYDNKFAEMNNQLKEYDNKFEEMNKHMKFLDMLKELKAEVPSLNTTVGSLKEDLIDANNIIEPLRNELKGTEKKVKTANDILSNMQAEVNAVNIKMNILKPDLVTQSSRSNNLTKSFNELELRVSEVAKGVSETEVKVLPSIAKQKQLVKNITETSSDVKSLKSSVNIVNITLADIETKMKDWKPTFDYVKDAVNKSEELEKKVSKIDINVKRESQKADVIQNRILQAKQQSNDLSQMLAVVQTRVKSSDEHQDRLQQKQTQLEEGIVTNDKNIKAQSSNMVQIQSKVSRFKTKLTTTADGLKKTLISVNDDVERTEKKCSTLRQDTVDFKKKFEGTVDEIDKRVKEEEEFTFYVRDKLPNLIGDVDTIKGAVSASIPWCSIMDILQLAAIVFIVIHMFCPQYSVGDTIQSVNYKHTEDDLPSPSSSFQRPKSILDQVHRAPVLDDKICIVSFYSDTKKLHRSLVDSAVELSRRGRSMGIVQHLVKGDDDILTIPRARYILVFVDYNERNVILENTGQDLGDKKVVTVQAAQKIGADVFVTYVRDKGSNQLFPGHLYNNELSAFTSHPVLKRLENNQRCFSVYESFNSTQREHIGKAIR